MHSLIHHLHDRAEATPDRVAFRLLQGGDCAHVDTLTWGELRQAAGAIARTLTSSGQVGDRVLIAWPSSLEFVTAFLGTVWAGRIPVPTELPLRARGGVIERLLALTQDCTPSWVSTHPLALEPMRALGLDLRVLEPSPGPLPPLPSPGPEDLCFLQYTSGSTGRPKGVRVLHRNLMHNLAMGVAGFGITADTEMVTWLPLFHDLGLMGSVLNPVVSGCRSTLMDPTAFLQRPRRWLEAITTFRATLSGGPDFAYALCARKVTDTDGLDLSSWVLAYDGAEPVRPASLDAFTQRFAAAGFDPGALHACYGQAETVVAVTCGPRPGVPPTRYPLDVRALAAHRVEGSNAEDAAVLVGHGPIEQHGQRARIVVDGQIASSGRVGELWLQSDSVCDGYWQDPSATAARFGHTLPGESGAWLRTGDLAAFIHGELVIVGRASDLIVHRGQNHHPADLERTVVAAHARVRPGGAAVVQADHEVIVVAEVRGDSDLAGVARAVHASVIRQHGLAPHVIGLMPPRTLPKTTSGKVRRRPIAAAWHDGSLELLLRWSPEAVPAHADKPVLAWLLARTGGPETATFAELGLDSARILELTGELSEHLGRLVDPAMVFEHPTPAALAAALTAERPRAAPPSLAPETRRVGIVGMSCRLPGADDPDALWDLLRSERVAIDEVPPARWSPVEGRPTHGGLLAGLDLIDAPFFGLADREADALDPQHRLLLEGVWRALEHAAIDPDALAGTDTGVFVGIGPSEYGQRSLAGPPSPYTATGSAPSLAAGRLAHWLGVHGPTLAVDTACSSSLVATHLALRALRAAECELALVAGVNLTLEPATAEALGQLGILSPTGRCAPFGAGADGTVRAEGCVVFVLASEEAVARHGLTVAAWLEGSAVQHDGRSNGLTAPHGGSQSATLRAALADAGLKPDDLDGIEAHGTGTALGDPVELRALARVFDGRRAPLPVSAIKARIGHTEAAAGAAGLLTAVLALRHDHLPALPTASEPTQAFAWSEHDLTLAAGQTGLRRLGVSSFGLSGTNAHVVVAAATPVENPQEEPALLLLSARTQEALEAQRAQLAASELGSATLRGVSVGRQLLSFRELWHTGDGLARRLAEELPDHRGRVRVGAARPKLIFLCPGQGALGPGVAKELARDPIFVEILAELDPHLPNIHLLDLLTAAPSLTDTSLAQPATVALGLALAAWWRRLGVQPDIVLGHSVGEITAAALSGAISEAEALRFARDRGHAMALHAYPSGMCAVKATRDELDPLLTDELTLAVHNAPDRLVVAGTEAALLGLARRLDTAGLGHRRLQVSHGFHSPAIAPALEAIEHAAPAGVAGRTWFSSHTAREVRAITPAAWRQQAEDPVRFTDALAALPAGLVVELGPTGGLLALAARHDHLECAAARSELSPRSQHEIAAGLITRGVPVDRHVLWGPGRREAPTRHPFDRARHWLGRPISVAPPPPEADASGLLHAVSSDPAGGLIWRTPARGESPMIAGGRYLLTGGFGGLGRELAAHLHRRWQARLVLAGTHLDEERRVFANSLGAHAVEVDLTHTTAAQILGALGPMDGIFHLAGTPDPERAIAVKADSLELLGGLEANLLVLFSSISATLPGLDRGLQAYVEANRRLDEWARREHAGGRRVTSVAFAPWRRVGLATGASEALEAAGLTPLEPELALEAMELAVASGLPHVVVLDRGTDLREPISADVGERLRARIARAAGRQPEQVPDNITLTELGIDSVAALDLVKDIEQLVGRGLPTTFAYEHDSVGSMLRALATGAERTEHVEEIAIDPDVVELLPAQQTFVVQRRFFPDMPGNVLLVARIEPGLQRAALAGAIERVASRHPALGSVMRRDGARWIQRLGVCPVALEWVDEVDVEAVRDAVFNLEDGPLWRCLCDGRTLALTAHHSALDAWSQRNVLEELLAAHEALRAGLDPELPSLRTSWPEVAHRLRHTVDGSLAFWHERLGGGVPPLHLPWTAPVSAPSGGGSHAHRERLEVQATDALKETARALGVSLPALVLAAYQRVLFDLSGQHDLTVRVAHARRELRLPDIDRVVGSLADSLPIRAVQQPGEPLAALARRLHEALAQAQAHADVSSMALAGLQERGAAGPVGLTPAGFSFPLLPADPTVGELRVVDLDGASASGFSRIGLIAWVFDGRLYLTLQAARSHLALSQLRDMGARILSALGPEPAPPPATLHSRILLRCRRHPERIALPGLSYGVLDRRSAALSNKLQGERIAVLADPGEHAVVALLAILRSGAAYVPLDPRWPPARIRQVLEHARAASLVVAPEHTALAEAVASQLEVITVDHEEALAGPDSAAHLAYVMYTSGSTGQPKGVAVSHRAHLVWQDWVSRVFSVCEDDRFLQTSSLGFGGSLRQIFTPLLHGASCHPAPRELLADPDALLEFIRAEELTIYNSVPSLLLRLIPAVQRAQAEGRDVLRSVRWVLLGGEAVPADLVRRWRASFGDRCRMANLYGSTESVVNATSFEIAGDLPPDQPHTPIGWPRFGQTAHLLDVHDGVGELAIGGAISEGYLHDPERTAEAFTTHPVAGRIYRTGDLARRQRDGSLIFLGRQDCQVQVHGNRVELSEIEHTLALHPRVDQALVTWMNGRLHARWEGAPGIEDALRSWVSERLPHYMVPHRWLHTAGLPRTSAGKLDRRAAEAQDRKTPAPPEVAPVAAPGDILDPLRAAWQEVLDLPEPPGLDDDFFALGGDSIAVLDVLDRLRSTLSEGVRPLVLYRHRTLRELSRALREAAPAPARTLVPPGEAALSEVQRGFLTSLEGADQPTWGVQVAMKGRVHLDPLRRAVRWLVRRHPQLRASFHRGRHGPVQHIAPEAELPVQLDDLSALPEPHRSRALQTRWEEEQHARFDLTRAPLVRVRLIRLAADRHQLLLSGHHVIADAWSCWVLAGELVVAHDAFAANEQPELPPPAATYTELAARPRPDDPWWRTELQGITQRPGPPTSELHHAVVRLSPVQHLRLIAAARAEAVSPFVMVLTAFARSLPGQGERVISTAHADRDADRAAAGVVGAFARGLPLRIREAEPAAVARTLGQALAHADASAMSVAPALGAETLAILGRYVLSWLDPRAVPTPASSLVLDWADARLRFAATATATEVMCGVLVHEGLHLHLHGGPVVTEVAAALRCCLRDLIGPDGALVGYAPDGLPLPVSQPVVVETVDSEDGRTELIFLPASAGSLHRLPDLAQRVAAAIAVSRAPVVALAGMLPALTGLGTRPIAPGRLLTTGHAVTVVAMVRHVEHVLARLGRSWSEERVAVLGYGAIGRATLALCRDRMGEPASLLLVDPALAGGDTDPTDATLILGATSGGATLQVPALRPATIVIDDSFPAAFDRHQAIARMTEAADVLLVGGGQLDVGPLERRSPFPAAAALRERYATDWLPGCHAEALLIGVRPELGPTQGVVDLDRARQIWQAIETLGWGVPPLHLETWRVPESLLAGLMP